MSLEEITRLALDEELVQVRLLPDLGLRVGEQDAEPPDADPEQQILEDFPDLTIEDIRACLAFAADRERKLATLPE